MKTREAFSVEHQKYLRSPEWRLKRLEALENAKDRCQVCNSPFHLDVHHRTYENWGNENAKDLTVLCRSCHTMYENRRRSEVDLRFPQAFWNLVTALAEKKYVVQGDDYELVPHEDARPLPADEDEEIRKWWPQIITLMQSIQREWVPY